MGVGVFAREAIIDSGIDSNHATAEWRRECPVELATFHSDELVLVHPVVLRGNTSASYPVSLDYRIAEPGTLSGVEINFDYTSSISEGSVLLDLVDMEEIIAKDSRIDNPG